MHQWFKQLFGFEEGSYVWTQSQFEYDNNLLSSNHTRETFVAGNFATPSISELRQQISGGRKRSTVSHEVIGDVLELHADKENSGDMFQVASQFNTLEFGSPEITPEDGITGYALDPTQGPACAIAAAAGTVYRNYLATVQSKIGQTHDSQINNLETLESILSGGPYWQVRNGYVESEEALLRELASELSRYDRNNLTGAIRIGIQSQTQVTFANRFERLEPPHLVSQAFCSAISCAYSRIDVAMWEPLAKVVLEAAYEGTLLAAAVEKIKGLGSGRVWLTFVGGGVFGNKQDWIFSAIQTALRRTRNLGLDVRICHFREIQDAYAKIMV